MFSQDQAVTVTAVSTNVLAIQPNAGDDSAPGTPKNLRIQVTEDFADCTSIAVSVETSDTEVFTVATELVASAAVPVASLVAGMVFSIRYLPYGCKKFVRLKYTVVGTATAGTVKAGLVVNQQDPNMG